MDIVKQIYDSFANLEKEDAIVGLVLIHPEDLDELQKSRVDLILSEKGVPRPEWDGEWVGDIWNAPIIRTRAIPKGYPQVLPTASRIITFINEVNILREERNQIQGQLILLRDLYGTIKKVRKAIKKHKKFGEILREVLLLWEMSPEEFAGAHKLSLDNVNNWIDDKKLPGRGVQNTILDYVAKECHTRIKQILRYP